MQPIKSSVRNIRNRLQLVLGRPDGLVRNRCRSQGVAPAGGRAAQQCEQAGGVRNLWLKLGETQAEIGLSYAYAL